MKTSLIFLLLPFTFLAQPNMDFEISSVNPYGLLNPEAPPETGDYAALIGKCDCKSTRRKADQTWGEAQNMVWTFKYIMNGRAVQDESIKEDGSHSGSIRQFISDSSRWYVHWYSNKPATTSMRTWKGRKQGDSLVLYNEQKAPNGMDGFSRLTFTDITSRGFNWYGEWVNQTETFTYRTWKIVCTKRED